MHGGVSAGGALFEVYDETGQLPDRLADGLRGAQGGRSAADRDSASGISVSAQPLGVKGLGEGGAISPPAAIANAIEDALAPFGVRVTETPVTASRIAALLERARGARPTA